MHLLVKSKKHLERKTDKKNKIKSGEIGLKLFSYNPGILYPPFSAPHSYGYDVIWL